MTELLVTVRRPYPIDKIVKNGWHCIGLGDCACCGKWWCMKPVKIMAEKIKDET